MAGLDWNAPMPSSSEGGSDFKSKFPEVFGGNGAAPATPNAANVEPNARPPVVAPAPEVRPMTGPVRVAPPQGDGQKTREETDKMGLAEFASGALGNAPASAGKVFTGLYDAATNPSQTWEGVKQLGSGIASKLSGEEDPEKQNVLNALLGEYADSYGSWSGFKNKLYNDPAFIGMDAATLIPGVGAGAKAAGFAKTAKALSVAEKVLDPVQGAIAVTKVPFKVAASVGKGVSSAASGVPKAALDMAQEIGASGDKAGQKVFQDFAMKKGNTQQIADTAVNALEDLKDAASQKYLSTRQGIASSNVQLPMNDIVSAMQDLEKFVNSHGTTSRFSAAQSGLADLKRQVMDTLNSPHPRARTMEDLDILKQSVQDLAQSFKGTRFQGKFGAVAGSIKDTIVRHDKVYADMMERYQDWLGQMKDLQTQLVGSTNASDTARIAKLMKSFGSDRKMDLLKMITQTPSGKYLPHMIAGHALSGWFPGRVQGFGDLLLGGGLAYAGLHPLAVAGSAALASPKIGGQLANKAGMAGRLVNNITPPQVAMKPASMMGNLEEEPQPAPFKRGGRVSSHDADADQLVRAAERAKKGWSEETAPLLNQSDEAVAHALEVANRSI